MIYYFKCYLFNNFYYKNLQNIRPLRITIRNLILILNFFEYTTKKSLSQILINFRNCGFTKNGTKVSEIFIKAGLNFRKYVLKTVQKLINLGPAFADFHWDIFRYVSKAALQRCSYEKLFWKYAVHSQENTHAEVWFQSNCKATFRNHTLAWVFSCKFAA